MLIQVVSGGKASRPTRLDRSSRRSETDRRVAFPVVLDRQTGRADFTIQPNFLSINAVRFGTCGRSAGDSGASIEQEPGETRADRPAHVVLQVVAHAQAPGSAASPGGRTRPEKTTDVVCGNRLPTKSPEIPTRSLNSGSPFTTPLSRPSKFEPTQTEIP